MNDFQSLPNHLGKALQEFKRSRGAFFKLALLSFIPAGIAALIFYGAFFGKGIDLAGRIVLGILGTFISLPAIIGIYMMISRRGSAVTIFENGLVYRYGTKEFVASWDDIAGLAEGTACRIELKNGDGFDMGNNVAGFDDVAQLLHEETLSRMLPKMNGIIDRGGNVIFNGIKVDESVLFSKALNKTLLNAPGFTVDMKGIHLTDSEHRIAWEDVIEFGIRQGEGRNSRFFYFFVGDSKNEFKMNYAALLNGHVLLKICEARIGRSLGMKRG